MKKKLVVFSVLTGLILLTSFSVFADTNLDPLVWAGSGFNSDNTIYYTYSVKGFGTSRYAIDINVTNQSSDESAVLNTSHLTFQFKNYCTNLTDKPTNITITEGNYIYTYSFTTVQTSNGPYFTCSLNIFVDNAVLKASESRTIHIELTGILPYNVSSISSSLTVPATTSESDPTYEATVTASNIASMEETIHQQEVSWYSANAQAINDVGLANFSFSSGTIGSFDFIQQQFGYVWSALGDLNIIYIFTMLISLATFILRHHPNTKRPDPTEDEIREMNIRAFNNLGK